MNGNRESRRETWTAERAKLQHRVEELEAFAEIVAHDLKEPLRGIRQHIDLLLQDARPELPPPTQASLLTVRRLAGRMTERLEALYQYACRRHATPTIARVEPRQVVGEVLLDLESWLTEHRACVCLAGPWPPLDCDAALLTEIFHNLITNAVKYNDRSEPHVEIGCDTDATFCVRDDGIGIRSEDRERIFSMFRRLHASGRYGGGAGAGLAIVRRLIECHGGRIWVESAPGQGSTFYFTLGGPAATSP